MGDGTFDGWPQWNEDQEKTLHRDLKALGNVPAHEARKKHLNMEKQHGRRRDLVWAELDEAPLARALEHLALLADVTMTNLAAGTVEDLAADYRAQGWKADDAVIRALAYVESPADFEAISMAIRSAYLPWAPLPSVTATGKPAVAPLLDSNRVAEEPAGYNFEPITAYLFRKTIEE